MPTNRKIAAVEELSELFSNSEIILLAEYIGTSVGQLSELRKTLNNASASFRIAKNTLAKLAVDKANKSILSEQIKGPIGFVFSNDEASSVTKSIYEFTEKNEVPFIVKIGLLNDELVDEATLIKLSKLPSKEVLLSKLIGNMNSPISNFVFLMSANVRSFVNVLQRHIDQSAKEEAPAEEPKEEAPAEEPNKKKNNKTN
ncbi:MAG: 50S ribosomal protein L10 [Chloroflexota bacterium]|nr:50S ribosomal protein L10 [Chloroflexota bacterium]